MTQQKDNYWDGGMRNEQETDYRDPANETLPLSRRSVASALPPPIQGARGVIVPSSNMLGAPIGYQTDCVATKVNVDPDIPGQGFVMDMSKVTKEAAAAAAASADLRSATNIQDIRFRAANAMRQFAAGAPEAHLDEDAAGPREPPVAIPGLYVAPKATAGGGQETGPRQPPKQPKPIETRRPVSMQDLTQPIQTTVQPPVPTAPSTTTAVKAADFGAPARPVQPAAPAAPPMPAGGSLFDRVSGQQLPPADPVYTPKMAPTQTPSGHPTFKVTFEVQDVPMQIEAWFHQVIRNEQVLALCFDTTTIGYPMTRLKPTEADLAIEIAGSDVIYVAQDPGIRFVHNGEEIQIFLIKNEYPSK